MQHEYTIHSEQLAFVYNRFSCERDDKLVGFSCTSELVSLGVILSIDYVCMGLGQSCISLNLPFSEEFMSGLCMSIRINCR